MAITLVILFFLPPFAKKYFKFVNNHPSEPEVKFILFVLSCLGFLASKAGSEAVLPAYLVGAALANLSLANKELVKRLRATTMALLMPFYFLKAGSLVDAGVILPGAGLIVILFLAKTISKFSGLFPAGLFFKFTFKVNMYNVMMMSTGLTFGTLSALYGLNHHIITKHQYSILVVVIIMSAIIPTLIAQKFLHLQREEVYFNKQRLGGTTCLARY